MHEAGIIKNRGQWKNVEIKFLQSQNYFTDSAARQLNSKLKANEELVSKNNIEYKKEKKRYSAYGWFTDFVFIVSGALLAAFALKGFLVPNYFFDGGITGISLSSFGIKKE